MPGTNDTRYSRRSGPRDRQLRVGDSERETVGEILRQQHLDGRLDADEFQERLERCLTAKTYAELDALVADFPSPDAERDRGGRAWGWRPRPFAFLPLALIAAIVVSGGHLLWLAFPLFFFFVLRPLLWRSWAHGDGRGISGCGPRHSTRTETRA
jgi:Domain of unknown function (DUF1707)